MTTEQNKATVRHFVEEVQNQGRLNVIDEICAKDFVDHTAPAGLPSGREGVKMQFTMLRNAFPDMKATLHEQIAEGEKVANRKTVQGTHRGEFMGFAPTGKVVSFEVIDMIRIVDGKIVEYWNSTDRIGLLRQLGVLPLATHA